jgi:tetratricopeptide (TPR) repeat protein
VIGRTSSFSFKGKSDDIKTIGQKLGVANVLEGSLRKSGGRLRITAQLVKAADGVHLWSQTFDRPAADVFAVQDEISREVVEALRVKLVPSKRVRGRTYQPQNQEAYRNLLLGVHLLRSWSIDSNRRALEALEKATEIDPAYPQAWAALANARAYANCEDPASCAEVRRLAAAAADRAVELAPDLPVALAARARTRLREWNWAGAKADIDRALEMDPDEPTAIREMAMYELSMGRPRESMVLTKRVLEKDPLNGMWWNELAIAQWSLGHLDEADRAFARALEIDPQNEVILNNRPLMALYAGRIGEALAICESRGLRGCMACAYHALGRAAKAQEVLDGLLADANVKKNIATFEVARVYACRGQVDQAFEWLERARERHIWVMKEIRNMTSLRVLHSDPRWAQLLRKMNLPVD